MSDIDFQNGFIVGMASRGLTISRAAGGELGSSDVTIGGYPVSISQGNRGAATLLINPLFFLAFTGTFWDCVSYINQRENTYFNYIIEEVFDNIQPLPTISYSVV